MSDTEATVLDIIARNHGANGAAADTPLAAAAPVPDGRAQVDQHKAYLRMRQAAEAELAAEAAPSIPPSKSLSAFLAEDDDEPEYRISGLWPAGENIVLAAQFKSGKTTLVGNLIRSLCDGVPFLDSFAVDPPDGRVFVIDFEMSPRAARRWLADQGIKNTGACEYVNLRGYGSSFGIHIPQVLAEWAAIISAAGASVVILDCIGPALAALGLDENKGSEVGRFLAGFEQLLRDAGASESFVVHHMGHTGERSRGASRLRDWPGAEWRLIRHDEDPASDRYLSAFGRDVEQPESKLGFDAGTRHLSYVGGSRKSSETDAALEAVLALLGQEAGLSGNAIETRLAGSHKQKAVRDALKQGVTGKEIQALPGPRNATLYSLTAI